MTRTGRRRSNLWLAGAAAAGLGTLTAADRLQAAYWPAQEPLAASGELALDQYRFGYESILGTSMDLVLRSPTSADAEHCRQQVLDEIERLRAILSIYDPASEISQVKAGASVRSPELAEVLAAYDTWNHRSGGAINVNMAQVVHVWKRAGATNVLPSDSQLLAALNTPMALNIDALGKGYIIDRAVELARTLVPAGMLNIGGDIRAWGDAAWRIGIADPRNPADNAEILAWFDLKDSAVATSGDYARYQLIAGQKYSHIIDPRTLRPARTITSATVIASDTVTANALATAATVLGAEQGIQLAQASGALGHMLVDSTGARSGGVIPAPSAPTGGANRPTQLQAAEAATVTEWPKDFQVSIGINLKGAAPAAAPAGGAPGRRGGRGGRGGMKRPYVAVWVQNADQKVVRTISIWGNEPRWTRELSYWWRAVNPNDSKLKAITRATRPPGQYTVAWDGKDDAGNALPKGKYIITLEINREHGGHVKESSTVECSDAPATVPIKATAESDEARIEYGPRSK